MRLRHVNWSEVLRTAIKDNIWEKESRHWVDPAEVEEALRLMDRVGSRVLRYILGYGV